MTHDSKKSDRPVVPTKRLNKVDMCNMSPAEGVEGRGLAKGNAVEQNAHRTQRREVCAPSALDRIRRRAVEDRERKFTALFHHVTLERLREAFLHLKKKAAAGVDGVTWEQYGRDLEGNLAALHARLQRGAYRARPSRRVYIPKADGRQRPLGIASLEDKLVQRVVVDVMNAVYEVDFLGFSYGFRPNRSPHHALDAIAAGVHRKKVKWVLDADIRGFFDSVEHGWLMKFLEHRIVDKRVLRLIEKWLSAGVMEDGRWTSSEVGTPQGATVSPLLANLYLHYVLDLWVQQWRKRHARGEVVFVRYADDFIVGFQEQSDAKQFLEELRERLRKFSLELHADKTRLIEFGGFASQKRRERGLGKPETFNFLGFTHICGKTMTGKYQLVRHTMKSRMRAKLREVKEALAHRQHLPIPAQGRWLGAVVRGYLAYHAVPTNIRAMISFRTQIERTWLLALRRRSQRQRIDWIRMKTVARRWLPRCRILHPWPTVRFDVNTQGRSRVR